MANKVNHNPAGKDLALHFNLITNVLDGQDQFKAELIVTNQSAHTLEENWSIYFNFLRMILSESVSKGFQMRHINGDYFCLEPTAESRYQAAKDLCLLPKESLSPIMPTPVFFEKKEGTFIIKPSCIIAYQEHLKIEAQFLADSLGKYLGKPLAIVEGSEGDIRLFTARVRIGKNLENWNSEAYTMAVDRSGVDLMGAGAAAVFYAVQSLIQLLDKTKNKKNKSLWDIIFQSKDILLPGFPHYISQKACRLWLRQLFRCLCIKVWVYRIPKLHFSQPWLCGPGP